MPDNGDKEQIKKMCPFLNGWCIGEACALSVALTTARVGTLGVPQVMQHNACAFHALCMMLSNKPPPGTNPPANVLKFPPMKFNKG